MQYATTLMVKTRISSEEPTTIEAPRTRTSITSIDGSKRLVSAAYGPTPCSQNESGQRSPELEIPKLRTRPSDDATIALQQPLTNNTAQDGVVSATGRFSPTSTKRRSSLQVARRTTRSIHSDMHLDEVPQDEDAAKWAEIIKARRASKKARTDTDDDRVMVGTKVDENHTNWVLMYNMLTGIRTCVSRTNAKIDRDLTDADFTASHKYGFDISGTELTPGAKYDFKFKDYAPWVFRHLRANFRIDPADYLLSLTLKYILSELGSPGKSGSFFYFSRDYKYIIKTIHHNEAKQLRRILPQYLEHVQNNPDTLLSQFYGLHRVKTSYGRKVHFLVMNNLFPPHKDIHRTFDLKGSTIGRDYNEDTWAKNPKGTLKDLNWLRRQQRLELGPTKKAAFISQMDKDVAFLQRQNLMDYSLLLGIHDLDRGNEDKLRDKTLRVFQPGGEKAADDTPQLARTPSKLEASKRAKELRQLVKQERPVPVAETMDKMPEDDSRKGFYFYAEDGGMRASDENDKPADDIYYFGIIDILTKYNWKKKLEHAWKGWKESEEPKISPIPPVRYGDRFVRFMVSQTRSKDRNEKSTTTGLQHAADGMDGGFADRGLSTVRTTGDAILPVIGEERTFAG